MATPPSKKKRKMNEEDDESDDSDLEAKHWFKCNGINSNFDGGYYNLRGDFAPQSSGVDWKKFEKTLDKKPELAFMEEDGARVMLFCLTASEPVVPVSVIQKLVDKNPDNLLQMWAPFGEKEDDVGWNVLQIYLGFEWMEHEFKFEVCKVLVEARPSLLLEKDDEGKTGYDTLKAFFPKEGEKLYSELVEGSRLGVSESGVAAINQAVKSRVESGDIVSSAY